MSAVQLKFPTICKSDSNDWLFWNSNLSWNTKTPDLTLCFQYTVLQWIPPIFLWLCCLIAIPFLWQKPSYLYKNRGKFNIFKSILMVFLLLIYLINLCLAISEQMNGKQPAAAFFVQAIISALTTLLSIYQNRLQFTKGVHTSGIQFFYWFFQLIVSIILVYSKYQRIDMPNRDIFRTVTTTIELIIVIILFLSNCFADKDVFTISTNDKDIRDLDENRPLLFNNRNSSIDQPHVQACPETKSSFLSQASFMWITGMMFKGYRKALTSEDLFDLKDNDSCSTIVPRMEYEWDREIERAQNRNKTTRTSRGSSRYKSKYQTLEDDEEDESNTDNYTRNPKVNIKTDFIEGDKKPSLLRAMFHTIGYPYVSVGVAKLFYDLLTFVQPQLLGIFISFIENLNDYFWHGIFISLCLFLTAMLRTIIVQHYWHGCYSTGMRARTAVIGIVYRKAMKLSSSSRKNTTVGEIVNLMSVDAQKLQDVPNFLHLLWSAPITIVVAIYFLWQELGPSVLAGLGLMLLLIPLNAFIGSRSKKLQASQMKMKDKRIKLMSEILNGMKILKLYAWELSFQEKIKMLRDEECRILRSATYLNAVGAVSWFCAPFLVALITFATYISVSSKNILNANKAFVSLSLFNILNVPMSMLPGTIVYGIQAYVSIQRINKFLIGEELDLDNVEVSPPNEKPIKIINGEFSWGKLEKPILTDINFEINDGDLIAIVGTVGSGKTSLTSALIGEMNKVSGQVLCRGSVAYVPQQAWCQNASLQDNIVFGQPLTMHRYNKVLQACALADDLKILPAGDQTEVGEKGVNLSGGQKQRISLARAVYQDASVYILDDPLSAVDSHVGKHIFTEVIGNTGILAKKTRILVTHNLTFLPKVDQIMVMLDGKISETGTYKELLANNGAFAEYIRTYLEQEEEEEVDEDSEDEARDLKKELRRTLSRVSTDIENSMERQAKLSSSSRGHRRKSSVRLSKSRSVLAEEEEAIMKKNKSRKLIEEESAEIGGVKFGVFLSYLKSTTFLFAFLVVASYSLFLACSIGANLFLSYWSEHSSINGTTPPSSRDLFLGVYGSLGLGQTIFILIENFSLAYGTFLASRSLHHLLLENVLRAPNAFFDTTPLGRILNRIGKDIDTVDINIPTAIRIWLATAASVFGTIIVISIASPFFLVVLLPLMIFYYITQRFYIATSRQLKRIDSIKRSPIYSHFSESIVGAPSIRAYRVTNAFIYKCDTLTDHNQMAWYPNIVSYRWLQFNLETIGNFIILFAGVIAVLTRESIGAGLAGLSVSYSLQITSALNFMVRMTCDLESYTVAVERIKEYADVEPEAAWEIPSKAPMESWPAEGKVEFRNYSVRYRPGLDLVLKNMNLVVSQGEKLGIVGRTGAGKSSLALALFRLIEPAEGTIVIDGIDVSKIGLHDLRSKLTIIPQDPVLFSGSLRMNLDPFDNHSDGELWSALELAHLKNFVSKMPEGLEYPVSESGENLSVGQRQLVCLARALLKKTKILVLDEATAAVDLETDDLIQNSIRRQFKSCTVLTIAHRLNTIMDYDRVLVLEQGRIREVDSPENLLANEKSVFHSMAKDAGLV